ncbi:choline kinase family protein [Methylobacterium oryzihabitans]|uniref:Choline/ethanolamine kinase--aminoglycoside phosphotransferase n=1 Tax=Methylobacterium oryzihabitans TaxID=2499852 RepID=A0A3S2YUD2_9HYPH|nr:choline kinase family protein [Methylobacterium oryzihabitans]RVU19441.1 choline/ethanolamine kinase--aminoglycoside phosphotransferase [Methylobacterium oryzihabitans]
MTWTSLGDADTDSERALEAILARVPAWRGRALRYRPVPGGISNTNWRIAVDGEPDCFLKVPGRGTEMFIARDAANDASRRAQACGFGVPVIDYLPEDGVEIFAFAEGFRASSNLDFLRPAVRRNAVTALRAFNDSAPLGLTKTIFDMIDEHVEQVRAVGGRLPADQAHLMRGYAEARAALTAAGLDLVPCMNDTLAGNFLIDEADRVLLVDFEYASNNERAYELALWFDEMAFPEAVEREMIETYFGRWTPALDARIQVLKALGDLKWATWATIQEAVSTLDFDYYKYGSWKHQRARTLFHHPDWPAWLRRL